MKRLETNRLILRSWRDDDLDSMVAINQDPTVCQYFPELGNRDTTLTLIDRIIKHDEAHGFSLYAVEMKATEEMIGFLGLMTPSFEAHFTPAMEIGWRLSSQHWNQGLATEGAKAVLGHAFTDLNSEEIVSFTVINNHASRRVMEKIGMKHNSADDFDHPKLGEKSPLRRHVLYRLSKKDWFMKNQIQPQKDFPIQQVIELYERLDNLHIPIWLDGGWGVDALLEEQTRMHEDLDIVIEEKNLESFLNLIQSIGYAKLNREDSKPWNFVLGFGETLEIDVHVVNFDACGNGIYGPKAKRGFYPAYAFEGVGKLGGTSLACLTPEYQIESHTGYILREKDFQDVSSLCERFNLKKPDGY